MGMTRALHWLQVSVLAFSLDGQQLATGGLDGMLMFPGILNSGLAIQLVN